MIPNRDPFDQKTYEATQALARRLINLTMENESLKAEIRQLKRRVEELEKLPERDIKMDIDPRWQVD